MFSFIPKVFRQGSWNTATDFKYKLSVSKHQVGEDMTIEKVNVTLIETDHVPLAAFCIRVFGFDDFECTWKPHLTPLPDMVISEKVFRSPAIIFESETEIAALIPNIDELEHEHPVPFIMDWTVDTGLYYGVGVHTETRHVYYRITDEVPTFPQPVSFSFYLYLAPRKSRHHRDFRQILSVLWELFAKTRMAHTPPTPSSLFPYMKHVYDWAFDRWKDVCWQEFKINRNDVGGVVFIVTAKQKPGLGKEDLWREPKSLWNQAWFCSLRSAYGYRLYAKQTGNEEMVRKSELALNFALAAPRIHDLFASYYTVGIDNSWENGHWEFAAPRRPVGHEEYAHLLDNTWTCYWLLKWYIDIEQRDDILVYVQKYAKTLINLQREDGGYPAWVRPCDIKCSPYLAVSPESAAHVMLFSKLYEITRDISLVPSMIKTADFLLREIIPKGRWEDFETYWSCAPEWEGKKHGIKDIRSNLYSQCTFGMYWSAEALLSVYQITRKSDYIDAGERVLAELSLYQAICRPKSFAVETLGGFGVMNCDDEWNDARQSLFALTYLRYYKQTRKQEYYVRALWCMKAAFYMMYCPENPEVKALYEQVHPQFDERDFGFHMENFNHNDKTCKMGLGEFTIFDWGNGAACESLMEFLHDANTL
jgi:hypothetical protein